jgi:DNA-binding Lrp family transcriptional regulator
MKHSKGLVVEDTGSIVKKSEEESTPASRLEVIAELQMLGVNTDAFDSLSMEALWDLLAGLRAIIEAKPAPKRGRPRSTGEFVPILSQSDKKILSMLITSSGRVSTLQLARTLDLPLSTVQRRRTRLEKNVIDINYFLKLQNIGWRSGMLFVSVSHGKADIIGKQILEMDNMVCSVERMVGESTMDLKIDFIFRNTEELLLLLDRIKSLEGTKNFFWGESVNVLGRNNAWYDKVIDSLVMQTAVTESSSD